MGISSPVFGLRPGRWFLSRRSKLPKPDSFTCSPLDSARAHLLEKQVDELARLALVETQLVEQRFGHFRFRQSHAFILVILASSVALSSATIAATDASASSSVEGARIILKNQA